ncbi:DgyrCDS14166, partial [Dimorphilus gyrociliatus]
MPGITINLSLLSRGVGTRRKNGHERIDVELEPQDYHNYHSARLYLPPVSEDSIATSTSRSEVPLPKTFTTRKGALILFSEDLAEKNKKKEDESASIEEILHTVEDLGRAILSYGGKGSPVNLKFTNADKYKKLRPGYSARRYLSRLTRSFDDSFLERLTAQGFVQEKTIYQPNAVNPSLRTRINDDLSALPPPYRILRQMLLAPGLLSGFSFAKTGTELEEITEEEDPDTLTQKFSTLAIVDKEQKKSIAYERLPRGKKEDVLADLLVKSAINDALDKQMRVLEEQALREKEMYDEMEKEVISEVKEEDFDKESSPVKHPPSRAKPDGASSAKSNYSQFDMGEAVMNYLESQLEVQSVKSATGSSSSGPKGSKVSMKSPRFKNTGKSRSLPDSDGEREYCGGIPVASLKDSTPQSGASSRRSSVSGVSFEDPIAYRKFGQLSPIRSVDETGLLSREQTFASAAALPPIKKHIIDLSLPLVQVEPPTPQSSTLTQASVRPTAVSREPTLEVTREAEDETTDEEDIKVTPSSSLHTVELKGQFEDPGSTVLSSSFSSTFHKHKTGNPAGWRLKDTVESKSTQKRKKKKGAEEKSTTGSVIVVPGGETVSVGGTIRPVTPTKLNASTTDDEKWTRPSSPASLVSGQQIKSSMERVELTERSDDLSPSGASLLSVKLPQDDGSEQFAFSPKPMSEHELVSALTEHAQKIASTILSRPGTGMNLEEDAK